MCTSGPLTAVPATPFETWAFGLPPSLYLTVSVLAFGPLSIAENIFAGRYPRKGAAGAWRIDWTRMAAQSRALLARLNLDIDVTRLLSSYPVAVQQMVAIARALSVQAKVLILFGEYHGTVRHSGFYWGNPFFVRRLISLRLHNMESARLKVNDRQGNPIEIAAVIVWRVENTAQACFDVDDYTQYVKIQSETAVRHLASQYAYDHIDDQQTDVTLRSGVEEVSRALQSELHDRLDKAGVVVEEARLTHLAYAPEIAGVMLRRQQAEAVIAARQKIVHGAVSMVQMALSELAAKQVIELDEERKAAMVSNLLVVLCGEGEVQPIINAGTLYT
jgi:regulator of protease activity HflC (stomatin/prohibitin superfamily)